MFLPRIRFEMLFLLLVPILPIYIFPSGQPQIFHFAFILCLMWFLLFGNFSKSISILRVDREFFFVAIFLSYLFLHAVSLFFLEGSIRVFLGVLYFLFNFMVYFCFRHVFYSFQESHRYFLYFLLTGIFIAVFSVFYTGINISFTVGEATRQLGFFNNPNQLGFYAVLCISFALALRILANISEKLFWLITALALFLAISSLSKAAVISIIFVIFFYFFGSIRTLFLGCLLALLAVAFNLVDIVNTFAIFERISNIQNESDSSLESRGYFLLSDHPIYMVLGIGEEQAIRMLGHEVHSTFAALYINYGFFGLFLFLFWGWEVFYKCFRVVGLYRCFILFSPLLLYSITHNGIRFSMLWVYLAFLVGLSSRILIKNKN